VIEVSKPTDFEPAFATAMSESLQGLHIGITPLFINHRAQLTALAANMRLRVIYSMREFPEIGGLMSYGMSLTNLYREKARLVGKILSGTSPADLPIERPTRLERVINLKAAKTLGLTVPLTVQAIADDVIE
jgi:putative ABC transport system substrate-binding protein